MNADWLVMGFGSPHGDDQFGWMVIEQLRQHGLDHSVAVSNPVQALELLPTCRRAILVDACRSGSPAGTITRLQWPDGRIRAHAAHSTHGLAIVEVLRLAELLARLPKTVVFYGLEIEETHPGCGPGETVRAAIGQVVERIMREIADNSDCNHA